MDLKQLQEEYIRLNREIEVSSEKVFNLIKLMITITITILTVSFTDWLNKYEVIYLIPIILIIPINFLIYSQLNSSERIAGYIRVFLEPHLNGNQWERKLREYKKKNKEDSKFSFSIILISIGLSGICYILCFLKIIHEKALALEHSWDTYLLSLITAVFLIISLFKLINTKKQDFDSKWKKVA